MSKLYFQSAAFDGQLKRAVAATYYQGADIGECLATAARIEEDNFDSWFNEWFATGKRVEQIAIQCEKEKLYTSAFEAYFRASNYFRTSTFFIYGFPVDNRLVQAYDKHVETFDKAMSYLNAPVEKINIPFEGQTLNGYFYQPTSSKQRRPTLIGNTGYDGTQQELFTSMGLAALKRGYNFLCCDGPGQGSALVRQQLYMRPNWETVITPVVNFLIERPEVDPQQICLYGASWAGYLATRAACYEHRLAALIVNPGQYNAMLSVKGLIPDIVELLDQNQTTILESTVEKMMSSKMVAEQFRSKMWVHGLKKPIELIKAWKDYTVADIAHQIQCPTLVMDAENELFSKGQAKLLYNALQCPKEYVLMTDAQGAGDHCGGVATAQVTQIVFDWLKNAFSSRKL